MWVCFALALYWGVLSWRKMVAYKSSTEFYILANIWLAAAIVIASLK